MSAARAKTTEKTAPPPLRIAFRKAAQRDIKPMAKVFQRAFEGVNEFGNPAKYLEEARQNLKDHRLIVAKAPDGKVAGFIMTDFNSFAENSVYVDQLAVDPGFQGHGIGRTLMKKAEKIALENGFNAVALHVRKDNDKAIGLYTSMGYKKTGSDWWYYADGTTGLEMVKQLRPPSANDDAKGFSIANFLKRKLGFRL